MTLCQMRRATQGSNEAVSANGIKTIDELPVEAQGNYGTLIALYITSHEEKAQQRSNESLGDQN